MSETTPRRQTEMPFRATVTDIFEIKGRIIIAVEIEAGTLNKNDPIVLTGPDKTLHARVIGFDVHSNPTQKAGLLLRDVDPEDLEVGMIVTRLGDV